MLKNASCLFQGVYAFQPFTSATVVSSTVILCSSPPGNKQSADSIEVAIPGLEYSTNTVKFMYEPEPVIKSVNPRIFAFENEGITVTVYGLNFSPSPSLSCSIGTSVYISSSLLLCKMQMLSGNYTLEVSNNGVDFTSSGSIISMLDFAGQAMVPLAPSHGPSKGGTEVTVKAAAWRPDELLECSFGNDKTLAIPQGASNMALCFSPPCFDQSDEGCGGAVNVSVHTRTMHAIYIGTFLYELPIQVISLHLSQRHNSSEFEIYVVGRNFLRGPELSCRFFALDIEFQLVSGRWMSSSLICCLLPSFRDHCEVHVEVSNNMQDFSDSKLYLSYKPVPTVTSVAPQHCEFPNCGGNSFVTVIGSHFVPSQSLCCSLGTAKFLTSTLILCHLHESHRIRTAALEVSNNAVEFSNGGVMIHFSKPDALLHISPTWGWATELTLVSLTSSKAFELKEAQSTLCLVGTMQTRASVITSTKMCCLVGPHEPESVTIMVSTDGGFTSRATTPNFTFGPAPIIVSLEPSQGYYSIGSLLSVIGSNFIPGTGCYFGSATSSNLAAAKLISSSILL